jgi:Antitoxin VbhA
VARLSAWLGNRSEGSGRAIPGGSGATIVSVGVSAQPTCERPDSVEELVEEHRRIDVDADAHVGYSAGAGRHGHRYYSWAWITLHPEDATETGCHRLLIRRNDRTCELAYLRCYSPRPVPALASSMLEGWTPTRESVALLIDAVAGNITADEYKARVVASAATHGRQFGQLPKISVPDDFDDPLPDAEIVAWEGKTRD